MLKYQWLHDPWYFTKTVVWKRWDTTFKQKCVLLWPKSFHSTESSVSNLVHLVLKFGTIQTEFRIDKGDTYDEKFNPALELTFRVRLGLYTWVIISRGFGKE